MITLTPTGDILIDGIKVGEWRKNHLREYELKLKGYGWTIVTNMPRMDIQDLLTNGFTPKKWEE